MKIYFVLLFLVLLSCGRSEQGSILQTDTADTTATTNIPTRPDHVFVVWLENKGYSQIIGNTQAPFINSLAKQGTLFTKSYAVSHPSYPNYVAFFAGATYDITNDDCIAGKPKNGKNLYSSLKAAGASFAWYSEDLPEAGSDTCVVGRYAEKHNPTTIFSNVPPTANLPLSTLHLNDTTTFASLPNVVCITPDLMNDMHDGSITQGDTWLKTNLSTVINWCKIHDSVFILYFDEDNGKEDNRIPVIMTGQHIKTNHSDTVEHTHYSFAKSILNWWGADSTFTSNLADAKTIQNIWR
jgi:phosphatidylinositol-3-phosphatase